MDDSLKGRYAGVGILLPPIENTAVVVETRAQKTVGVYGAAPGQTGYDRA